MTTVHPLDPGLKTVKNPRVRGSGRGRLFTWLRSKTFSRPPGFAATSKGRRHPFSAFVSVLLLGGIGYTLADRFYPAPAVNGNGEGEITVQPRQADYPPTMKGSTDISGEIANLHLFGKVLSKTTAPVTAEKAPATTLKLVLRGIIAAGEEETSFAIIADAKGRQNYYAVGAQLPEGATILAVHDDYVVLRHNERSETLRMLKPRQNNAGDDKTEEFLPRAVAVPKPKRSRSRGSSKRTKKIP
uniref:Type IV pilus biogenesis n=1 Tax=Candidatus Kentrum sp. FM TaxID=2126340 RepID=A0A450U1Y4_9GAMM|nr:MAG: Type IV pilus biogenesis [Candidatus Kentron sp. FM]VFJ77038.1 MAG: Type IV pilus biogenesis [Candidatus Kentron sp. FM]VFK23692.1 MAG: Type IV pilus biogenesis [Candidatus Kentron sp. FM]